MNNPDKLWSEDIKGWPISALLDRLVVFDRWNEANLWPNFYGITYKQASTLLRTEIISRVERVPASTEQ